jgi:hypothetical protein
MEKARAWLREHGQMREEEVTRRDRGIATASSVAGVDGLRRPPESEPIDLPAFPELR